MVTKSTRVALYARTSTLEQQSIPVQLEQMRDYAARRGWEIVTEVREVGSGAKLRPKREGLMQAARRRNIDAVVVAKLDRWGRSLSDLVSTMQELSELNVAFVSVADAIDLTTPSGRALAGMLAVFASFERDLLRDRVKSGVAHAQKHGTRSGKPIGRPRKIDQHVTEIRALASRGMSCLAISKKLRLGYASCHRVLNPSPARHK